MEKFLYENFSKIISSNKICCPENFYSSCLDAFIDHEMKNRPGQSNITGEMKKTKYFSEIPILLFINANFVTKL